MADAKSALRATVSSALVNLTPAQIATQSAAVFAHLQALPTFASCRSASVYLPMDGGNEISTWPIVSDLLSRGARVAIPKVSGPNPTDMKMLLVADLEQARSFPRNKWGIPEPSAAMVATMEDATESSDLSVLLVPAVAFDARCGRLGHGRGFYDAFISRQRALTRPGGSEGEGSSQLLVIGLALSEQMVEAVPMVDGRDQWLGAPVPPTPHDPPATMLALRAVSTEHALPRTLTLSRFVACRPRDHTRRSARRHLGRGPAQGSAAHRERRRSGRQQGGGGGASAGGGGGQQVRSKQRRRSGCGGGGAGGRGRGRGRGGGWSAAAVAVAALRRGERQVQM
jgi:5-formyltetrahydrofolate cyclo-ligase